MHNLYAKETFMRMTKEQLVDEIYCYHHNCSQFEKLHSQVSIILQRAIKECPEFNDWYINRYMPACYTKTTSTTNYFKSEKE